jgi:hypothetical protein
MVKNKENAEPALIVKKRGRKSKKELELAQQSLTKTQPDNINVIIEETVIDFSNTDNIENILDNDDCDESDENEIKNEENIITKDGVANLETKPIAKKRGRKPKGGKIIQQIVPISNNKETKSNVILHLKCSLKDLQINSIFSSDIQGYNFQSGNQLTYDIIESTQNNTSNNQNITTDIISVAKCEDNYEYDDEKCENNNDIREVWKKLKQLEHNLHINNICDKKSACFWCTYEFDNPPVYIPKHYIKDSYQVYGCFCSPECATAYLMEENIDSSSKFERYHLINHIYSKIYDYKKNIKPAPNPFYMLEKYYGNLSIQEYRALLKNERLFLIVDKPLTRILPELHEDNDDFIINNKIIPSNTYQIKKKLQNKQTKNNILTERFGLSQQ